MKKTTLCLSLCSLMLLACSNSQQHDSSEAASAVASSSVVETSSSEVTASDSNIALGDNSQNSLDWDGKYLAKLPCADCDGITTELVIYPDQRYEMSETYVGKDDKPFKSKGKFEFDKTGMIIQLDKAGSERQYFVAENALYALDSDGKKIEGSMADQYILQKQN